MLPAPVAKATGAIVLDLAVPTIAMIEDLPEHVERIAVTLKRRDFDVWLMTAK